MPKRTLVDHALPIVAYLSWLKEEPEQEPEDVRVRFESLFRAFDREAQADEYSVEATRFAMFALVALIDEILMGLDWPGKGIWLGMPLQLLFFDTNAGGEEFYQRLEQVRERIGARRLPVDVLEVYCVCLSLGFYGRLGMSVALREQHRDLIQDLTNEVGSRGLALSGRAGDDRPPAGIERLKRLWLPPLVGLALLALILIIFRLYLGSATDTALGVLGGGQP